MYKPHLEFLYFLVTNINVNFFISIIIIFATIKNPIEDRCIEIDKIIVFYVIASV